VRTILKGAADFLTPEGILIVEVGANRAAAEAAFPRLPFTWLATPSSEDSLFLLRRVDLVAGERAAA
jgi:ribosomal protein L3 glutamine methyltransferase